MSTRHFMKTKKRIIINITLILTSIFIITGCKNKNSRDNNVDNSELNDIVENENIVENKEEKVINSENNTNPTATLQKDDNNSINTDKEKEIEYTEDDNLAISTFSEIEKEVDQLVKSESSENIKDKLKGTFITIVDFIFYDSEINGVKFNDLTEGGKNKVLEISKNIDNKIENKYPNYKESISDTTKNAYNKASEVIKKGANNIKDFSKDKLGEDNYNAIVDAKDELVYYTKNAFDIIGDVSSNLFEKGKTKVKKWYENFKKN